MEENNFLKEYLDWRLKLSKHPEILSLQHLHFYFRKEKKKEVYKQLKQLFEEELQKEKESKSNVPQIPPDKISARDSDLSFSKSFHSLVFDDLPDFQIKTIEELQADLIIDLIQEKTSAYLELYESEFFKIRKFVTFNSGSLEDAQDVFQEGIVVLLEKLREPGFKFSCAVGTYLYSCCKNIWQKEIRKRKNTSKQAYYEIFDEGTVEIALEDKTFNEERLEKILTQLSETCLKLIKAFYYELKPWSKIAQELNYSTEGSAKNQKYKCLKGIVV